MPCELTVPPPILLLVQTLENAAMGQEMKLPMTEAEESGSFISDIKLASRFRLLGSLVMDEDLRAANDEGSVLQPESGKTGVAMVQTLRFGVIRMVGKPEKLH
jgi:hypothetical protein